MIFFKAEYLLSQELEMFEQMENGDKMHKNIINKIKKLTPRELTILDSLLESYFSSLKAIKEQLSTNSLRLGRRTPDSICRICPG